MLNGLPIIKKQKGDKTMKRIIAFITVFAMSFAAILCLTSCKGKESEHTVSDNTPVPVSDTTAPANDTLVPTAIATEAPTETPAPEPTAEPTADPNERPDTVTVEWLAMELMRRYNTGIYLTHELEDYSNIMDRNEETDLFYYDNQLEIDRINLYGQHRNVLEVNRGESGIQRIISESESEITVDVYVTTLIPDDDPNSGDSVGTDFRITVDKQRMVIVAYDRPNECEGYYRNELKPLALRYRNQGMSWQDADKKAYDEIYARLESEGY